MKFEKIHNKGQARLFKHPWLEALTKTHPLVIWGMYIPIIIVFLWLSGSRFQLASGTVALLFLGGVVCWTLFEYLIHRYAFHFGASSERAQKFVYLIHGNHHEYPRDKERLFMPPLPSLLIAAVVLGLQSAIFSLFGALQFVLAFFPGFIVGYLIYGSMHYAIHAFNPPFQWMKPLWRNHHLHHYKEQEKGFGVSSTLWDHVFGTMFNLKEEKEDKEKVRQLMFNRQQPARQHESIKQ
jgi:sterol desaturase/sphingolipid hydroxylase (fatty acid hydroxylase superfamily)